MLDFQSVQKFFTLDVFFFTIKAPLLLLGLIFLRGLWKTFKGIREEFRDDAPRKEGKKGNLVVGGEVNKNASGVREGLAAKAAKEAQEKRRTELRSSGAPAHEVARTLAVEAKKGAQVSGAQAAAARKAATTANRGAKTGGGGGYTPR